MVTTWDAVTLQLRQRHAVQPSNVASRLNMHAQGGGKIDPANQDRTACCVFSVQVVSTWVPVRPSMFAHVQSVSDIT